MKHFSIEDTALVLLDQARTDPSADSIPLSLLHRNVIILARFAKRTRISTVLAWSQGTSHAQDSLIPQLRVILPEEFATHVEYQGVFTAWDDANFANACRKTGKRNLMIAGVATEISMISCAICAVEEGFNVKVVSDSCCSNNLIADEMLWRRSQRAGVKFISTSAIVTELVKSLV